MCVDGQPAEGVVTDEDGAVTALPGMGDDEDDGEDGGDIAPRAIANGNLHLTLEELLAQQRRDLALMLEEEREAAREKAAQAAFEAERKAAEAAAAQEAREAYYKQDGEYDRSKDPRNNLEEGMKTATPSYQQLLLQGRKKRTEYKQGKKVIRALSYEEVRASENIHRRGIAFVREWHAAQAEWHAENVAKLARVQDADAKKEASRRAREQERMTAAAKKKQEKLAEKKKLAKKKAEERAEKQGKAIMYVVPSDEVADKTTGFIPTVTIGVAQPSARPRSPSPPRP